MTPSLLNSIQSVRNRYVINICQKSQLLLDVCSNRLPSVYLSIIYTFINGILSQCRSVCFYSKYGIIGIISLHFFLYLFFFAFSKETDIKNRTLTTQSLCQPSHNFQFVTRNLPGKILVTDFSLPQKVWKCYLFMYSNLHFSSLLSRNTRLLR